MRRTTNTRGRSARASAGLLAAALLLNTGTSGPVRGQNADDGPEVGLSQSAPRAPEDPDMKRLEATIDDAREQIRQLEAEIAGEAEKNSSLIVDEQRAVTALRDEKRQLEERLRQADSESQELDAQSAVAQELQRLEDVFEALTGEVESQALDIKERFADSLFAAQYPGILETVEEIGPGAEAELEKRVEELLGVYDRIMKHSQEVGVFEAPVRLSGTRGTVKRVDVLRLGLVGGFYSDPSSAEAGFVLLDNENAGSFIGESAGISSAQRAQIAALVANPERGGFLPLDVTGGGGLASLRSRTTLKRWFELGGVFMYPLLAVALASLLLVIERGIVLSIKAAGLRSKVAKVLQLIEDGRVDEAERLCRKWGGAVGNVLNAALAHRDQGRAVMEDAVQEALLHHAPSFHTRLSFIALCAAVAPLLGLLGTVTGMITTFKMVTIFGTSDPRFMAGGISEALITTQAGLYTAIPSLLMRGILGAGADRAVGKLEAGALSVVRAVLGLEESGEELEEAVDLSSRKNDGTGVKARTPAREELSLGEEL